MRLAWIGDQREWHRIDLIVLGHLDGIGARQDAWTICSAERRARGGRNSGRRQTHRPCHSAQAASLGARNRADSFAARIEHLDLHVAEDVTLLQVVSDHRRVRRIVANERSIAVHPPALRRNLLHCRSRTHEHDILHEGRRRQCAERCDIVDDPDAATVRCDHQIIIARLDCQIPHGDRGKVSALVARPLGATIE